MGKKLWEKLRESSQSVLPVGAIVLLLHFTIAPMPLGTLSLFITGLLLLVLGMSLFMLGSDMAMIPMGELIGAKMTQSRKLWLLVAGSFLLGVFITVAEPDLQVLTKQVPSVPDAVLLLAVAVGVGLFLVLAVLRVLFRIPLSVMIFGFYSLVFIVAAFTAPEYVAMGFDSGGVTTGPITVPFILAIGVGVSAVRSEKSAEEDSFGLVGLSSIGPILAVLLLGMFYDPSGVGYSYETTESVGSARELVLLYGHGLWEFFREVLLALLPIVVIFVLFQLVRLRLPLSQFIRIGVGVTYALMGLTVFLVGANIGFMPAAEFLGKTIGALSYNWILIPLGALIGFFVVAAEPAVPVLNKQVSDITSGAISRRMMMAGFSVAVGIATGLSMIRIMTGWSIWYFLLPGYALSLALMFVVPRIFTAIAFDSGGVASGTMTATFLLSFAIGVSDAVGGNMMTDAFGIVAMVAMMPPITIQLMGLIYQLKLRRAKRFEDSDDNDGDGSPAEPSEEV